MALLGHDLLEGIEAADAAGYDTIELWAPMVLNYFEAGHTLADIDAKLKTLSIHPFSLVPLDDIDVPAGSHREQVVAHCRQLCMIGQALGCQYIQMLSGSTYGGNPWKKTRRGIAKGLAQMADIAAEYGLMAAYEPLAWRPVWSVNRALEVIEETGRPNVRLLIDTFHAFAAGDDLEAVRALDPGIIATFHLGDAAPRQGPEWTDDERVVMPGDGVVPLRKMITAVLDTGYRGLVSDEVFPTRYPDWSAQRFTRVLKARADAVLASVMEPEGTSLF
jgi:4-hydroxyphenylpyruvate dioxygenase